MDFLDQAQGFIEKAQERMADATTLAAWKANQAVRVKALQKQITEIEKNIEAATLQLGNQVFRMWKRSAEGSGSDAQAEGRERTQMEDLCRQLDGALARYRQTQCRPD